MEYFQIIFVHEGDTDKLYIRKLIEKLYPELNVNKLTFISMNGKTNYIKMERKIEERKIRNTHSNYWNYVKLYTLLSSYE